MKTSSARGGAASAPGGDYGLFLSQTNIWSAVVATVIVVFGLANVTGAEYTLVWEEGFNGAIPQSWKIVGGYSYSAGQNHGDFTGAGAAYGGISAARMWRNVGSRPLAECHVSAWFYDFRAGYSGECGVQYRQTLGLTTLNLGTGYMVIEHPFYSSPGYATYNYRTLGLGAINWSSYGNRWPGTPCTGGGWIHLETTVVPGNPGASPVGTFTVKATDGGGSPTTTQNLTTDFFDYGVGCVFLGRNESSQVFGHYWDDIRVEATVPAAPVIGQPTVNSPTQIRWSWARADNNLFGFDVSDEVGIDRAPAYPNAGWLNRGAESWTESGLVPNSRYSRKVHAWNGPLDGAYSATVSCCTLSVAPVSGSVTPDASELCLGLGVTWTAVGGFGSGKVEYYRYAWDQSATRNWTGSEEQWSGGTLSTTPTSAGTWYLHVKGYNGDGVANGTYDYPVTVNSAVATSAIAGRSAVGIGQAGETYSVTPTAGSSYVWTVPSGAVITAGDTGPNNNQITVSFGSTGGNVTVTEMTAGGCVGSPVSLAVAVGPNHAPQARNIEMGAQSGVKQSLPIIHSAKYAPTDDDGDPLVLSAVNYPGGHGATVSSSGDGVEFTALANYAGPDSFTYTVSDGRGGTATAMVTVTVTAVANQEPAEISVNGDRVSLVFWGVPGETYTIERSEDLSSWGTAGTAAANDLSHQPYGQINFSEIPPPARNRFYRLRP